MRAKSGNRRHYSAVQICSYALVASVLFVCTFVGLDRRGDMGALFRSPAVIPLGSPNTTGTLLTPLSGNTCRQRWIDNATGQIHDGGIVDCAAAKAKADEAWAKEMAERRQTIFRNGFVSSTGVDRP